MSARHKGYHERQRAIEQGARKRLAAKQEERATHAEHVMNRVLDMLHETGQNDDKRAAVSHNPRTGRYTVHLGNTAKTFFEKDLTAYIEAGYAKQHEAELTAYLPEDDK